MAILKRMVVNSVFSYLGNKCLLKIVIQLGV